jgi:hypothetical protein
MPEEPPGDIHADETAVFGQVVGQLNAVVNEFTTHSPAVNQSVAVPPGMEEGVQFSELETAARDMLRQFLANTTRGLQGYQSMLGAIGQEYENVIALNTATMQRLLQSDPTPVAIVPQSELPEVPTPPPANPPAGSN